MPNGRLPLGDDCNLSRKYRGSSSRLSGERSADAVKRDTECSFAKGQPHGSLPATGLYWPKAKRGQGTDLFKHRRVHLLKLTPVANPPDMIEGPGRVVAIARNGRSVSYAVTEIASAIERLQ